MKNTYVHDIYFHYLNDNKWYTCFYLKLDEFHGNFKKVVEKILICLKHITDNILYYRIVISIGWELKRHILSYFTYCLQFSNAKNIRRI